MVMHSSMLKTKRIRIVLLKLRNKSFSVEMCSVNMSNFLFFENFNEICVLL